MPGTIVPTPTPPTSLREPSLGAIMEGTPGYTFNNLKKESTYSRTYRGFQQSDALRGAMTRDGATMKTMGEQYSYTVGQYFQFKGNFHTLTDNTRTIPVTPATSAGYAISQYGEKIEYISGYSMKALVAQTDAYSIQYMIYRYFDSIAFPQEDDLVFYSQPMSSEQPLVGIFMKLHWNSSSASIVVSKYNDSSSYVFQHDVFFVPRFSGDEALFYRLKKAPVLTDFQISPLMRVMYEPVNYTTLVDSVVFIESEANVNLRNKINQNLFCLFPKIQLLEYIKFVGVCYNYAFGKFFNTYSSPCANSILALNNTILVKYFDVTLEPQTGDLVIYYDNNRPVHYGIYIDNLIESKWGWDVVHRHPYFDVPIRYGNQIRFLKLKCGLSKEMVLKNLILDQEGRSEKAPIILQEDEMGTYSLLLFSYRKPNIGNTRKEASKVVKRWTPTVRVG